jgi:threonine dehydrogenase-like Zn-dependent dehydrogenase
MKAILVNPGRKNTLRLEEVDTPRPLRHQALLRPLKVGIDGTDLEIADGVYGEAPRGSDYLILGHECLAIVEEPPEKSNSLAKGDLVVPTVRRPDFCYNCRNEESDMCLTGEYKEHGIKGLHGFASEYCVSDADFLVKVPDAFKDVAVLLEPTSIAEKAILQSYRIQQRLLWDPKKALILGAGPLGQLLVFLLRLRGLEVYAVAKRSKDSLKARLVEKVGGIYINAKEQDISSLGSFDLVIEATGNPAVALQARNLLNRNGVMCLLGIYPSKDASMDIGGLYTDLVLGNKTIFGSVNANRKYFESGLTRLGEIQDRYPGVLQEMITISVPLEEYMKTFQPSQEDIKSLIDFT